MKNFIIKITSLFLILINLLFSAESAFADCTRWAFFANEKCVIQPDSSTYFNPSLLMQYKVCGFGICSYNQKELQGYGECTVLEGIRFCARATASGAYGNNNGRVQICGFEDPMDGMDTKINFMPYQNNQSNDDQTVTKGSYQAAKALAIAGAFAFTIPGFGFIAGPVLAIGAGIAGLVGLIQSTWNHVVITNHGCIDIPNAPFPPPFTSVLTSSIQNAQIQRICNQAEVISALDICVIGNVDARFEIPSARVSYNNPVPLCNNVQNKQPCVNISNMPSEFITRRNMIGACSDSSNSQPCYIISGNQVSSQNIKRIVYSIDGTPNNIVDWSSDAGIDLKLYGINDADYYDMGYDFSSENPYRGLQTQIGEIATPVQQTINQPILGKTFSSIFQSSITYDNPTQLCIIKKADTNTTDKKVGCVNRPPIPFPLITKCGGSAVCNNYGNNNSCTNIQDQCVSTSSDPKIIVALGNPIKQAVLDLSQSSVFLYGAKFSAILTDENYTVPTVMNPQIVGKYAIAGNSSTYLQGVEYDSNGVYQRGASQICVAGYNSEDQVLAKLNIYNVDNSGNYTSTVQNSNNCNINSNNIISEASQLISDRVFPNYSPKILNICKNSDGSSRTLPKCPDYEQCCNSCDNWPSGNNLDNNGNCKTGYIDVAKIMIPPLDHYDSTSILCKNADGSSRAIMSCPDGAACYNSCLTWGNGTLKDNYLSSINPSEPLPNRNIDVSNLINPCYEILRNKNPLENNLCISAPPMKCPAITIDNGQNGNATWPETIAGEGAIGQCANNYQVNSNGPPIRKCYPANADPNWNKSPIKNPCIPQLTCPSITSPGPNDGNATWESHSIDNNHVNGKCIAGYHNYEIPGDAAFKPYRMCILSGNNAVWSEVSIPCVIDSKP